MTDKARMIIAFFLGAVLAGLVTYFVSAGRHPFSTGGYIPAVVQPDPKNPPTSSVVHWVASGNAGTNADTLNVQCTPPQFFSTPAFTVPVTAGSINVPFDTAIMNANGQSLTVTVTPQSATATGTVAVPK